MDKDDHISLLCKWKHLFSFIGVGCKPSVSLLSFFSSKMYKLPFKRDKPRGTIEVISLTIQNISVVQCVTRITLNGMFKIPP